MKRLTDGAGYLFNDNRAAHEGLQEADIGTCPHCQALINIQEWRKDRSLGGSGWCLKCQQPVCNPCAQRMLKHGCEPFIKKVEEALDRQHRASQYQKILER